MRALAFLFQIAVCLLLIFHYLTCATQHCPPTQEQSFKELELNSSRYHHHCVTVTGKVIDKLAFVVLNLYYLRDTEGNTLMVTVPFDAPMPSMGDELEVSGQLSEFFNISDIWNPWVIVETNRNVTKRNVTKPAAPTERREGGTPILPY
ncbi:MAG: hypothetical protein KIS77_09385 [Saprospiraceae bacterium]|nr:hypothetical protein [Saprospiraceae bacterium]